MPTALDLSGPENLRSGRAIAQIDTSGIGRGLESLGASLQSIGAERKKQDALLGGTTADGIATKQLNDFERSFDSETDYGNFQKRFEEGAAKIGFDAAQHIGDPQSRASWLADFNNRALSARNRVLNLSEGRQKEQRLVNYKIGLQNYQSVIADPNASEEARNHARQNAEASIAAAKQMGDLSPSEAQTWHESVINGGDFVYGQREIEKNPGVITGKLPVDVAGKTSTALSFFMGRGYTKEQAAGIVGNLLAESSLNPGARNGGDGSDGSDSIGIGQWNSGRAMALKQFAADHGADWRDFSIQLAFVDHELNTSEAKAAGMIKGATDVKSAAEGMIMYERPAGSDKGPQNAIHYNKRLAYAAQAAGESVKPEWFTSQPPDKQLQLEKYAAAEQDRQNVQARGLLDVAVQNAPSAIMATGSYSGALPTIEQFQQAYPQDGAQRFSAFKQSLDIAQTAHDFQTMSNADILATVSNARPTSSGNDAALQQERYQTLSQAADNVIAARKADPFTFAQQAFPHVRDTWQAAVASQSPADMQAALSQTAQAQQSLGITQPVLLPATVATQAVATFQNGTLTDLARFSPVASLLTATEDKGQKRAIFEQLVKAGMPPEAEGAAMALARGDEGAAQRLFQAAFVDVSKLPGTNPTTPEKIAPEVQSQLFDTNKVGDLYYGLTDGTAKNYDSASRATKLLGNAVMIRMRNGETLEDAVGNAGRDLFGNLIPIITNHAEILVPADQDPQPIVGALSDMLPEVKAALDQQTAKMPDELPASDGTRAIVKFALTNHNEQVLLRGKWRNSDDGQPGDSYVFMDPYTGLAVQGPDGNPMQFRPHPVIRPAPTPTLTDMGLPFGQQRDELNQLRRTQGQ